MNIYYLLFNLIFTAKLIYADIVTECKIVSDFLGLNTEKNHCCYKDEIRCNYSDLVEHIEHIFEM